MVLLVTTMDRPDAPLLPARFPPWLRRGVVGVGLAVVAAALLVPGLGGPGLWDPHEISRVEAAHEVAASPTLTVPERHARPPVPLLLLALGLRVLGTSEVAVRLPVALCALLTLGALYPLGRRCGSRRAGALAVLVLLTGPTFFLGARQATVHLPAVLAHILAVGGLSGVALPERAGRERVLGGLAAAAGLVLGFFSVGAPLGVGAPLLGVALTLALGGVAAPTAALLGGLGSMAFLVPVRLALVQAQLPPALRMGLGAALALGGMVWLVLGRRRGGLLPAAILVVAGAGLGMPLPTTASGYSPWLGGWFRWPPSREVQIDTVLRPLGFQLFPWAGLLPVALASLLGTAAEQDEEARDRRALQLLPVCWFVVTYLAATYQGALAQEVPFPALGALALAAGLYLDRALAQEAGGRAAGLVAGLLCGLLGRDLYLHPEQYGGAHFLDGLRWPAPLAWVSPVLACFGLGFGAVLGLGLALSGRGRRGLLAGALGLSLAGAFVAAYGLIPQISRHVSYRGLFARYRQLGGSTLGLYAVPRSGSKFYDPGSVELGSVAQVFEFLQQDPRAFVLVGATELAALDQHARQHGLSYHVLDDSNVQFLLVSSRLPPGETDRNPLRRLVLQSEPRPQHELRATFEDRLELLGYDLPPEIVRGQDFTVRLYFKVLKPVGGDYKIFLHIEGGGSRINGDHSPLDGKFPTRYWVPGSYVIDEHRMSTGRMGHSPGLYQVLCGLWPGGSGARMRVTTGPQDGDNRVKLGSVRVK